MSGNFSVFFKYVYSMFRKDIRTKFIFFIIGVILWFNINLEKEFETNIIIPIKITNIPANKTLLNPIPTSSKIKVRSKGKSMLMTDIQNSLFFEIDLSTEKDTVISRLNSDLFINLTSNDLEPLFIFYPQEVVIILDDLLTKKVPIISHAGFSLAPGYIVSGKFVQEPDSIIVSGPAAKVDKIRYVNSVKEIKTSLKSDYSVSLDLLLKEPNSIRYSTKKVDLYQKIVRKGFHNIKVPVRLVNKPDDNILINPVAVDIEISGPVNELQNIRSTDFIITADYDLLDEINDTISLDIKTDITLPWNVKTHKIKVIRY